MRLFFNLLSESEESVEDEELDEEDEEELDGLEDEEKDAPGDEFAEEDVSIVPPSSVSTT